MAGRIYREKSARGRAAIAALFYGRRLPIMAHLRARLPTPSSTRLRAQSTPASLRF
jgi:hypothetical protein